jgi:hypothetical protein
MSPSMTSSAALWKSALDALHAPTTSKAANALPTETRRSLEIMPLNVANPLANCGLRRR